MKQVQYLRLHKYNCSKKTNISHCQLEPPLKAGEIFFKQKTDISQLEPPLIMAGADEGVFTKLVLVSAAGDDMIVVISINATEEGGKCQKNQRLLS